MNCSRCGKEINEKKTYVEDTHMGQIIGVIHMTCFNKMFRPSIKSDMNEFKN